MDPEKFHAKGILFFISHLHQIPLFICALAMSLRTTFSVAQGLISSFNPIFDSPD